jgi:hypothetical protein
MLEDQLLTVTTLGGFVWLSFAVGMSSLMDFPWDVLQFLLAVAGTAAGVAAWLAARQRQWRLSTRLTAGFIVLLVTWAAWVPFSEYELY